jgi:hypothetical protein
MFCQPKNDRGQKPLQKCASEKVQAQRINYRKLAFESGEFAFSRRCAMMRALFIKS